jgi:hypothetical protein
MPRPPHPPRLYNSNYTWRKVQIMKLLVMQFLHPPITPSLFRSKYSPSTLFSIYTYIHIIYICILIELLAIFHPRKWRWHVLVSQRSCMAPHPKILNSSWNIVYIILDSFLSLIYEALWHKSEGRKVAGYRSDELNYFYQFTSSFPPH